MHAIELCRNQTKKNKVTYCRPYRQISILCFFFSVLCETHCIRFCMLQIELCSLLIRYKRQPQKCASKERKSRCVASMRWRHLVCLHTQLVQRKWIDVCRAYFLISSLILFLRDCFVFFLSAFEIDHTNAAHSVCSYFIKIVSEK